MARGARLAAQDDRRIGPDRPSISRVHAGGGVGRLQALQSLAGNRAVAQLLRQGPSVQRACCGGCASGSSCEQGKEEERGGPGVQRAILVEQAEKPLPGEPARKVVDDAREYLSAIAPGTTVADTGEVTSSGCGPTSSQGPKCVCDLAADPNPDPWKIQLDDTSGPHTSFSERRVFVHSTRSIFEFGSWGGGAQAGQRTFGDGARVLAHELCGHAHLEQQGLHPKDAENDVDGGRPDHDPTIAIENKIAQEIDGPGADVRGSFADPHHGESFARVVVSGYPSGQTGVFSLPADQRSRLDTAAAFLKKNAGVKADVMGHADRTGNAAANESITRQRATNVKLFLQGRGIASKRFLVNVGKSFDECPNVPGGNPACRKVEVFIFGHDAGSESHA